MAVSSKRTLSVGLLFAGIIGIVVALYLDITGSESSIRGTLLMLGAAALLMGVYFFPTGKHRAVIHFLFLLPLVFCFAVTVLIPFACGIVYSFTDWNGIKVTQFVGLGNYIKMFQQKDYLYSLLVTVVFVVGNMIIVNVLGFSLALLCTSNVKCRNFLRASYFLPNLIGGIVLGYVWQFVFNKVLVMITGGQSMLTDPNLALLAILIVSGWQYAGYIMMIYVTGLISVPGDVLEAAGVDGANAWQTLWKIKFPIIMNTVTICIFMTLTSSFKQFDLNMSITSGAPARVWGGKMVSSTELLALNIYKTAIAKNDYALGQTKAVVFFIILAAISLTQVYMSKKREVEM